MVKVSLLFFSRFLVGANNWLSIAPKTIIALGLSIFFCQKQHCLQALPCLVSVLPMAIPLLSFPAIANLLLSFTNLNKNPVFSIKFNYLAVYIVSLILPKHSSFHRGWCICHKGSRLLSNRKITRKLGAHRPFTAN